MTTRHKIHKTPLTEAEFSRLRRVATALRRQCAPFIRDLIEQACDDYEETVARQTHPIAARANVEGPRQGHIFARRRLILPNKALGQPTPHLRV